MCLLTWKTSLSHSFAVLFLAVHCVRSECFYKTPHIYNSVRFSCGPCCCEQRKYPPLSVDCRNRTLENIPEIHTTNSSNFHLPANKVIELGTSVQKRHFTLDLGFNKIERIVNPMHTWPKDSLSALIELNLEFNFINMIAHGSFCSFLSLKWLKVSNNKITTIVQGTFECLKNLQVLILSDNNLVSVGYDFTLMEDSRGLLVLFLNANESTAKLKPNLSKNRRLIFLNMQGNCHYVYPNDLLGKMLVLSELRIDGMDRPLFNRHMLRLETLKFGPQGICNFKKLKKKLFKYAPNLRSLFIEKCHFYEINHNAFEFNRLREIHFDHITGYSLYQAFNDLKKLRSASLEKVHFVHLYDKEGCARLSERQGLAIKNLKLKYLSLKDNCITVLTASFLQMIPVTLRQLDLSHNWLHRKTNFMFHIPQLTNLIQIDISNQNVESSYDVSRGITHTSSSHSPLSLSSQYGLEYRTSVPSHIQHGYIDVCLVEDKSAQFETSSTLHMSSLCTIKSCENMRSNCAVMNKTAQNKEPSLPIRLTNFIAAGFLGFGDHFLNDISLAGCNLFYVNLKGSYLKTLKSSGLPASVTCVDFGFNHIKKISRDFIPAKNSLKYLSLEDNHLGHAFAEDKHGEILSHLANVRHLELSRNDIYCLPEYFLRGLPQLEILNLRENRLRLLNMILSHITNLKVIDLSNNAISHISSKTLQDLDAIASRHTIYLNLMHNAIPCTCSGLPILEWMVQTKVRLIDSSFLQCLNFYGDMELIGNVSLRVNDLQLKCTPQPGYMKSIVIALSCFLPFVVTVLVIYRNRWKIRYMKNCTLVKCLGLGHTRPKGPALKLDAYILYEENDLSFVLEDVVEELQRKRGHKLCLEDRDFIPGTFNIDNMICAIQNSTVTLMIVSPSCLASSKVEYAVQMATMEEYYSQTTRPVLQLLMYKPVEEEEISPQLWTLLRKGRFLDYPVAVDPCISKTDVMKAFWDKLSEVIGHTSSKEWRSSVYGTMDIKMGK